MGIFIDVLAILLGVVGIIGCFIPIIPGPPISWGAMLVLYIWGNGQMSLTTLLVWLGVTIVVSVLDYLVPSHFTRITGGSKVASRGSLAGLLAGLLIWPPWGMIPGAFLGALLAEILVNRTRFAHAWKPALGALLGFIAGTMIKLVASSMMFWFMFRYLN